MEVTSNMYFRWPTEVTSNTYFRGVLVRYLHATLRGIVGNLAWDPLGKIQRQALLQVADDGFHNPHEILDGLLWAVINLKNTNARTLQRVLPILVHLIRPIWNPFHFSNPILFCFLLFVVHTQFHISHFIPLVCVFLYDYFLYYF